MADAHELFKRLSTGAKFDKKTLKISFQKLQPRQNTGELQGSKGISEALDFFGNNTETHELDLKADQDTLKETGNIEAEGKKKAKKRKHTLEENHQPSLDGEGKDRKRLKGKLTNEQLAQLHLEQVQTSRHAHRIFVKGSDIPDPTETFSVLKERYNLADYIIRNVKERGYAEPTPIQMQAMPLMLHGREVLCCAPTGSGKTVAFIVPLLHELKRPKKSGFRALVISPTRELAQQIYREFCHLSKGCAFKIHILTKAKASSNNFGSKALKRFDILVTTPNRLVHLLAQDPPGISLHSVKWLVLDEADKLFEQGKDGFRDQIATIYQECDNKNIKHALFSATLSNGIEEWAQLHLDNHVKVTVGVRNSATKTVEQELLFVGQESGKLLAVHDIIRKGFNPPVLIFVQSKDRAKELFHELIYDGINVDVIHSDRTQAQRDNIVKSFRSGKIWVLIATELMGRGIDFKGVNLVINYDFPTSAVSYIHRIGRTGRAGRAGKAVTFFTEADVIYLRSIANVMKTSGCKIPDWMLKIKKPSRKTKKHLTTAPVKRSTIKTVTTYDLNKAKRKRNLIEASKKRKTQADESVSQEE
ncbi:probable ATP-dependent RNA helicase DDX52 [Actinia tenebrosa]|uniref:Probable ATP-dependent RNA helicase DDX52 n=1 Tax=Actinia tenebrosa TaxID=6105 RepID=A0A6P8HY21_ACTTE|nr:probable ATP-dependent RNA helicase DDX52 [Actinia tenebrosa]